MDFGDECQSVAVSIVKSILCHVVFYSSEHPYHSGTGAPAWSSKVTYACKYDISTVVGDQTISKRNDVPAHR